MQALSCVCVGSQSDRISYGEAMVRTPYWSFSIFGPLFPQHKGSLRNFFTDPGKAIIYPEINIFESKVRKVS